MVQTRNTIQKIKIREYLIGTKKHPTAETVHRAVSEELPTITLATVYRNLNKMVQEGEVRKLEVNGEYHYDGDTTPHSHCVCSKCGKITDLHQEELCKYVMKKMKTENFEPDNVNIMICGVCKTGGKNG